MKNILSKIKNLIRGENKTIIVVLFFILIILIAPIQKVEVGHQGIMYNSFSGSISSNYSSGWHVVIPFVQSLTSYPIHDQAYKIYRDNKSWNNGIDASITAPTSDNQKISIDATFIYELDKEKMSYLYDRFNGKDISAIEKNYLDDIFRSSVVNAVSQYSAYDVYSTKRVEIQTLIFNNLTKKFNDSGIIFKDVYIDTVRLSSEIESIIRAEALAEAARIEAQGKSDANRLISDSLTDKIMTYETLSQLSESLRLIIVPSGTDSQLDFSRILEQMLSEADSSAK